MATAPPIAVVPIFVTAGSAVLPTVLAVVAGGAAVLLRPGEWAGLVRRRPGVAVVTLAALALLTWAAVHWVRRPAKVVKAGTDWVAVARQIIAREEAGPHAATTRPTAAGEVAEAVVEGRTFARRSSDGGPGPVGLKPLWAYAPGDTMFLATPAVHGRRVFVAGCTTGLGDFTGLLACLDADTGKPLWEVTEINGEPLKAFFSSPAVTADGARVVIGQGFHQDRDCPLLCFDAATGKPVWSVATTEHVESSPAISGGVAYVGVGAIEDNAGRPTGHRGYLMAVRISDGKRLWQCDVADCESTPAVGEDGTVYVGSGLGGEAVVAVTPASVGVDTTLEDTASHTTAVGQPVASWKWHTPAGTSVTGAVTLAGDLVVVGSGNGDFAHSRPNPTGAVIAFDRQAGRERWRTTLPDTVLGPVAFAGDTLYAPSRSGEVVALDAATGRERWRTEISRPSPVLGGCAVTSDRVYAMAADGVLAVLDRGTGRLLEGHAINAAGRLGSGLSSAAPQAVGGRVYAASETGGVQCLVGTGGGR